MNIIIIIVFVIIFIKFKGMILIIVTVPNQPPPLATMSRPRTVRIAEL